MAAMTTTPFFSSPPSTAFLSRRNPNSSYPLFSFSPLSISISTRPNSLALRSAAPPAASAVEFAAPPGACDADASRSENLDISKLGISQEIVAALSRRGITELFPIQRAVLEPAMEGRDMIGRAITGSGKTLAFGIPILDKIIQCRAHRRQKTVPSALILAPTRELARQVQKELKLTAPRLNSVCLYGGIPIINQVRLLGFGVDIAVGTPGRIIDLIERGTLDLSEVKFVVLDEADQMLAVGFQEDVERILSCLPAKRQCMLFSATMPSWVNGLSRKYLRKPLVIDLVGDSDQKLAEGISLYSVPSSASNKPNILPTLISKYAQGGKIIIFTKTKKDAEVLSRSMGGLIGSQALHGNMQQFQRDKTLAAFREGRFNVLVATDVAARGLDIPNVDLVIHFEIPNTPEIFVHRSGRTGRAGKKGTAVLIFTESQRRSVKYIERDLGCKFEELPRIKDDVGNIPRFMDVQENQYGRYDDSFEGHFGNFKRSRGPNYGNAGETRGWRSSTFSRSSENSEVYENSRSRNHHKNPGTRHRNSTKPRTQFTSYDDFEDNYFNANPSRTSSFRRRSRSMDPKYHFGSGSFASERRHHDEWNSDVSEDTERNYRDEWNSDVSEDTERNHHDGWKSMAEENSGVSEDIDDGFKQILDVLRNH